MILDLDRFIRREQPYWDELEAAVDAQETAPDRKPGLAEARRFHYLYQRVAADLSRLQTFSGQQELRRYLEQLVARAYIHLHGERERGTRFSFWQWLLQEWPRAFRRHAMAFWLAFGISVLGAVLGGFFLDRDSENMKVLVPAEFAHLLQDPSERVREEEAQGASGIDVMAGQRSAFAGQLMLNNIKVALKALAFGILFGFLTVVILFYNGVLLGAVVFDYTRAGETEFLLGWLLPHGVPELTAIFVGGQAGLVLAGALFGWGSDQGLRARFRAIRGDLATLAAGLILMLVWAGIVEAFFSQYHYPTVSYTAKIAFGVVELVLLVAFFGFCGRDAEANEGGAGGGAAVEENSGGEANP